LVIDSFTVLFSQSVIPSSPSTLTVAIPAAPPAAPVKAVTDDYYGIKVVDPYRYMEDLKNPQVEAWFKAQNDYTRGLLARIPGRQART
jgi:prolyl oligopeptidase